MKHDGQGRPFDLAPGDFDPSGPTNTRDAEKHHCPKCGDEITPNETYGLYYSKCGGCHGGEIPW